MWVLEQSRNVLLRTTVIPRCLQDCGVQVGLGLPRAGTDLLHHLEPL